MFWSELVRVLPEVRAAMTGGEVGHHEGVLGKGVSVELHVHHGLVEQSGRGDIGKPIKTSF